ncbi:MAG: HU family DNA-binding protein [Clostridia bacterium]|nr:HU family DNA-binding protein [Clostridia bacterium]
MNKSQLIDAIAKKTGLTKEQSAKAVEAYHEIIEDTLNNGDELRIVGFGTYRTMTTKEHTVRHPITHETITVKAMRKPAFKFTQSFTEKFSK